MTTETVSNNAAFDECVKAINDTIDVMQLKLIATREVLKAAIAYEISSFDRTAAEAFLNGGPLPRGHDFPSWVTTGALVLGRRSTETLQ